MDELEADGSEGSYVEGSAFVRLLDSPGKVKLLDVFLGKHYQELSAAQVADLAGVDVSTFHRNVDTLVSFGVVEKSRTVGGTQLYRLDRESPVAKGFGQVQSALLERAGAAAPTSDATFPEETTETTDEPRQRTTND